MIKQRALSYLVLLVAINTLLALPSWTPFGQGTLMDWQRQILGWNYVGASFLYVIFILYTGLRKHRMEQYEVHLRIRRNGLSWVVAITLLLLVLARTIDYMTAGSLTVAVPALTTVLFQLVYISLGEELWL